MSSVGDASRWDWLCWRMSRSLFELHTHVVEDEGVDVCLFLEDFCQGLAAAVTRLGVDADEYGRQHFFGGLLRSRLALLQGGSELKRVGRHHTVVVVGSGDEGGRVGDALLQIVQG